MKLGDTINDQAARWAVRVDAGPLPTVDQAELDAWLAANPRHLGAFVRARAQWVRLDRAAALNGPAAIPPPPRFSHRQGWTALAAGLVLAMLGGVAWLTAEPQGLRFASSIGEVRRIPLEDGSVLLLNTDSEALVRFQPQRRDVVLVRGEALFDVAHDASRPFVVQASEAAVRAVGTKFAVRLEAEQIDVTVAEGIVEVSEYLRDGAASVDTPEEAQVARRVVANHRAVIPRSRSVQFRPTIEPLVGSALDRQLAWRQGMVSFDGETLASAVAQINRHNRRRIVIEDAEVASRPVVGVFQAGDIDAFAAAAEATLNLHAVADGEVIRLQK